MTEWLCAADRTITLLSSSDSWPIRSQCEAPCRTIGKLVELVRAERHKASKLEHYQISRPAWNGDDHETPISEAGLQLRGATA